MVREVKPEHNPEFILVKRKDQTKEWIKLKNARNGFSVGNFIVHQPPLGTTPSLGFGIILLLREELGLIQALVQFAESGEIRWVDWRTLAQAHPVEARISHRRIGSFPNHAERFRLRTLAKSLKIWDTNTGALGRLDIDPLPHQLDVARKVVSAPQARWLLADDVGLGKTIEVGLILHALEQRNRCRRILIVCPASLTRQWKEEMRFKFSRMFEIFNRDFTPEFTDEMLLRERVIISLDLAKRKDHLSMLLQAGTWDVIIFDEAHRLGRGEDGMQTDRYKLAKALQDRTASMLLLTATPHQGKRKRFEALLELVRPDLKNEIRTIEMNPEIVKDIIIRNKKARITDADGNILFRGHDTKRYQSSKNEVMTEADDALTQYLRKGYRAIHNTQDKAVGRAIGFVMTTYRKLASSSIAAIEVALERRLEKLVAGNQSESADLNFDDDVEGDDDLAEKEILVSTPKFFDDEVTQLSNVIRLVKKARHRDNKLDKFIEDIAKPIISNGENVLIFTEYRATQTYLEEEIQCSIPRVNGVELINGSMNLDQKMDSVFRFNERKSQVLISTEAGGEGLNLQKSCHLMVNYDLPWNPSRLVQRIGRLYRYGQMKRVTVLNLHSDDNFDSRALSLMFQRVDTIAEDMAAVDHSDSKVMKADILGELLSHLDMESILESSETLTIEETEVRIESAIQEAKDARSDEEEMLQFSSDFDTRIIGGFDYRHIVGFVEGMCNVLDIKVRAKLHNGKTLEIVLPAELVGQWPEFRNRNIVRLTVDHDRAQRTSELVPMDLECTFIAYLISVSQDRIGFDGLYAESPNQSLGDLLSLHQVRWQGIAGEILEEELVAVVMHDNKCKRLNHQSFSKILLDSWESSTADAQNFGDRGSRMMAKTLASDFMKIIQNEVTDKRSPSSVFTYAACRNSKSILE